MEEYARLSTDPDYKRIASSRGSGRWVSTVWLGLNHNYVEGGPPLIFETMVFPESQSGAVDYSEIDTERYSTEEEARTGHERMARDHAYVLDKIVKALDNSDKEEQSG